MSNQLKSKPVSLLELIGNTPLLDLSGWAQQAGVSPHVKLLAKAEWFNPGQSVKARAALQIMLDAVASGELTKEKVLIDSSSGNTAISYAQIGAIMGYRVQVVMPSNVSAERKALVSAFGAKLTESDPLEGSDGAIQMVRELYKAHPERYYYADQYSNPSNWQAHLLHTGPEIWTQTQGQITHFVCGLGTTGTFVGAGRYLRAQSGKVKLISVQPEDELSVIEGLKHLPSAIPPSIYDSTLADLEMTVDPETSWETTRRLGREQGFFIGLSAGAAVSASLQVARELEKGTVVTLLPDDGSKYVSLGIFN